MTVTAGDGRPGGGGAQPPGRLGPPALMGVLDATQVRPALAAGCALLTSGHGTRVLVGAVDAAGSVLVRAPSKGSSAWAAAALAGADGDDSPRPWMVAAPAGDGVRAIVVIDDPMPSAAFAADAALVALGVARAIAVERDRAHTDEMRRLGSTAKSVALSLELDGLIQEIIEDAASLIGADSGDILLLDEGGTRLSVMAVANFPPDMLGLEFALGEGLSSQAMAAGHPLIVSDYKRYEHRIVSLDRYDLRSVLCAPLMVRGRAIGSLNVHGIHARREFSPHDAELLAAFADLAAIAIDHARRYENEQRLGRQVAAANDELTRVLSLQRRLSEQVVADVGVAAMIVDLSGSLGRPLAVQDQLGRLVAGASPDGTDAWQALVHPRRERPGPRRERQGAARTPSVALDGEADGAPGAAQRWPVRVGRDTVAHLIVGGSPATGTERALIETACTGLALEFAKRLARVEVEHRLRGDAVMDLLSGSYTSEEAIVARVAHLGHDIAEPHDVLVVDIDDFHQLSEQHGETHALRLKQRFFDLVHAEVVARAPGSLVSAQSDSLIVLLAGSPSSRLSPQTLAVNLQQLVSSTLPGVTISVGMGDRTARAADYAASYRLARDGLDLMRRLGRRAVVIDGRQLGAYRLLLKASEPDEMRAYARRLLGPLLDPDRRGAAELLATLRVFLETGGSQRAAARACSVHVNTVVYRLARISELLGLDLSDPSAVFDLTLAFRIIDVAGFEPAPA